MKMKSLLLLAILTSVTFTVTADAALFYSGVQNVAVPVTMDGEYLRMSDGATSGAFPADWSTAPWLNPFFGGVDIANSPLLRPIITGTDQILNLAPGTVIDGTGNFVAGESGSSTHVGAAANQFHLGTPGIMGFVFEATSGGASYYGWARLNVNNVGAGSIVDWAYDTTPGTSILAGQIAPVPEPVTFAAGLLCLGVGMARRRRNG